MKKYVAEPFKIKMVEPIKMTTMEERINYLEEANYNVFALKSDDIYIDLLTDSGTGAMSDSQWAGIMIGDESYAGARGYAHLVENAQDIFGYRYVQPVHQGRAAEKVLFPLLIKQGQHAISNMFFDTTRAHVELSGGKPINFVCEQAADTENYYDFKGNLDIEKTEAYINKVGVENIAVIVMTITNNSAGGQPVSMQNIKDASALCKKYNLKLVIDAARFAENAYFIKTREEDYKEKSIKDITKETFSYADALTMSAKKDAIVNMGGLVCIKDDEDLYQGVKELTIAYEGFVTYGGLAGRDLEALAIGLKEGINYDFLKYRIGQIEYLGDKLREAGIPFQYPAGGHAIFLDAKALLPHISFHQFPGQALTIELYKEAGIRACDIGSYMLGVDAETGEQLESLNEFCRLAIPRRVYTQAHLDVVVEALVEIKSRAAEVNGYEITWQPKVLRHFTSKLKPIL
ncbi:tryptophanase [Clostridium grantii]|uniref:Tryptophanase n=1 Tax=Clostridium grantii DSM 8605 TaxID=1121316 RepID=A0A1M5WPS1_9CLOT|nr:tryptophanase [Clostridium grantii]SHH89499.1 tryptophanase [Clostridium grantii DSM 8605]